MVTSPRFRLTKFRSPHLIALAATLPLSMAMASGLPIGDDQPSTAALSPTAAVERARQLLSQNQPVAARALLLTSLENDAGSADPARSEAFDLLAEASKRIRTSDPLDVSLQKARVALDEGDIRTAERQAQAVLKSTTVKPAQSTIAEGLLASIQTRRAELAAEVPAVLEQARLDFDSGRYAQAKSGLQRVDRSGVKLTAEQQTILDTYQMKLVQLSDQHPGIFGNTASAGMMQPATVKRRDDAAQPAKPAPADLPAAQPEKPAPAPANQPANDAITTAKRFEAEKLLAKADADFRAGRFVSAKSEYGTLNAQYRPFLTADQNKLVEDRLAEATTRSGGSPNQPIGLGGDHKLIHDQTVAEFNNDLDQANRSLKGGAFNEARIAIARARLTLNSNRNVFAESEIENMNKAANAALSDVEKSELAKMEADRIDRERNAQKTAAKDAEIARSDRDRKIVELIDRARSYQSEMRYEEALQAVDQLLFLDPINPTGLLLRDAFNDIIVYRKSNRIYDAKHLGFANLSLDNQEAAIPPVSLINYPLDWPAISVRRGEPVQFAETPENKAVLSALATKRIPNVAFNDNSLQDVVEFVKTVTQLNVDTDWTALEAANIHRDTTVSLNLTNVTAKALLDRIVEKVSGSDRNSRADWAVLDGVVTIASDEKIRKRTELVIYDVKDLLIEVPDYRDVPRIDLQQALQASQGGGGGGQSPFRNENEQQDQQARQQARDRTLDELISIIRENVDQEGWTENGGDTGKITKVGNAGNLIITNTPKNHRQIAGLLSKLREIRAMQINVEARFLLVNQDYFEQIGFDIDLYLNAGSNQVRAARNLNASVVPSDFFVNGKSADTGNGPIGSPTNPVAPKEWSPIGFQQDSLGLSSSLAPKSDWSDTILGAAPALGVAGQFLDDIQVDFLLQATQADRRSIQLTAPRLTFTNGQTANIYVATQTAFVSDLQPVVGDSAVGFDPTVAVVTEGVTLLVEGTVSADRRYVTMNVDAGIARVDGFAQQSVSAIAGGQLVSSATTQSFIQLPKVTVTRVRSTVTVPDQGTILMGGQRLTTEYEIETGVPVLSKIPIINRFFTNRVTSKEESTLLILVKPTVIIQTEEEERNFPGLQDSVRNGLPR